MSPSKTAAPGRLLTQAAGERQTGALVVQGHPGGTVYLLEGLVTYAESPAAPGVGELLTASGRLAGRTWQAALDAGTSMGRVGQLLLDQGHLTRGELELCVLGATYGAAVEFLPGATHWLGPVIRVDPAAVNREARRRVKLLAEIFPHPEVDAAPVIPVPRPPVERVTVTAPQWELLVHADGQRTPADLAQLLGRAGYATVQELRRMAAAGLIERPEPPPDPAEQPEFVRLPRVHPTAVDAQRPAAPPASEPPPAPKPPRHANEPESSGGNGTVYRPPRLTRRKPGAKLPKDVGAESPPVHNGADEVLLKRIRTALRALR